MRKLDHQVWSPGEWTDYGGAHDTPWGPRLSSFSLNTQEWREAFLERLVAVGEPGLLEAAARVYDELSEPKGLRCTKIAMAAGVSGSGKLSILKTLQAFLDEWLRPSAPCSSSCGYGAPQAWHNAVMRLWDSEQQREHSVVKKFAAALNGEVHVPGEEVQGLPVEGRNVVSLGFWKPQE